MKKEYAVYKGDKFLFIGTADEIAKQFKVKRKTVYFWVSPANKRRAEVGQYGNRRKECSGVKIAERL